MFSIVTSYHNKRIPARNKTNMSAPIFKGVSVSLSSVLFHGNVHIALNQHTEQP